MFGEPLLTADIYGIHGAWFYSGRHIGCAPQSSPLEHPKTGTCGHLGTEVSCRTPTRTQTTFNKIVFMLP